MRYFVLKVHSRCDLACDHCYVYEHADQSWRGRPHAISSDVVRVAAKRIADHAATHELPEVQVILHGGEPLLIGKQALDTLLGELRDVIQPVVPLDLRMQSNGTLLTPEICDILLRHRVRVGISLDGDRVANDRHRRFATGASSHSAARRALALLREPAYRDLYAGILCTVDIANDPIAVYDALAAEAPPRIDFLLPHATWEHPPLRPAGAATPYADWLGRIHRRWVADARPMAVRLFDSLAATRKGGPSRSEAVGLDPADLLVIETDGAWEQADSLKTAYDGAAATGLDVFAHSVDEVAERPEVAVRQRGLAGLSATCRACPVVRRCGGGLYAHRYRDGSFDNPSVYCADLKALIAVIDTDGEVMPDRVLDEIGSGYGDIEAVAALADAQVPITRVLLAMVGEHEGTSSGWELLAHVDATAPAAAATVFAHPYVRAWAVRFLDPAGPAADAGHLARVAAAAAARAGQSVRITVPVRDGLVPLPTLGAFAVDPALERVELSISDGRAEPDVAARWLPARHLRFDGQSILVEDTDPYRDCHTWPVADRLDADAAQSWQELLTAGWTAIQRDAPAYADAVRAAFRTLVPLAAGPPGQLRSATNRDAFGAVGMAAPSSPDELALLLVHEVQHVKLGGLLDRYDLIDPDYRGLLEVPWRSQPRPAEAVLQGTYAFLAVADVWRARSRSPIPEAAAAGERYARYRDWVSDRIGALRRTDALLPDGERFVRRMLATIEEWRDR